MTRYTWDRRKNRTNVRLHGIAFEDAISIFDGPVLEKVDDRFDYGETRYYSVGVSKGIEITVISTDGNGSVRRIISAWRSERHEREAYWQECG